MMEFVKTIAKRVSGVAALALVVGMTIGTANAGDLEEEVVPSVHGGSAGFVDLDIFNLDNEAFLDSAGAGKVTSISNGEEFENLLITTDPATGRSAVADMELIPTAGGQITGIVRVTVFDNSGILYVKEVPARGIHRFIEIWRRDYRNAPSSVDGELTRVVNHTIGVRGGDTSTGVLLIAKTDPQQRVLNSRLDVAPWIGRLVTSVDGRVAGNLESDLGGFDAGTDLVFFGPRDLAQWWEVIDESVVSVSPAQNRRLLGQTRFYTPYNRDQFGTVRPISDWNNGVVAAGVSPAAQNQPLQNAVIFAFLPSTSQIGRYGILYRGNFGGARSILRQVGFLLANASQINQALANETVMDSVFGDDDPLNDDGLVYDLGFINSSPAARTIIRSARDHRDLF